MQNLVPPSHFDKDSLNGSPQPRSRDETQSFPNQLSCNIKVKPLLKTPGDFGAPSLTKHPARVSMQQKTIPISSSSAKSLHSPQGVLQDSGYDWERSKGDSGTCDNHMQILLTELKEENNHLHEIIKRNQSEKDSKCNYNVITHQVQYIERLQHDLADTTSKLQNRENHISRFEVHLQEKNVQIQQQSLKLNQLSEELEEEKEKASQITDSLKNLKQNLLISAEEQRQLQSEHKSNLDLLKLQHEQEIKSLNQKNKKEQEKLQQHFETEKQILKNEFEKDKHNWKIEHQSLMFKNQSQYEEKLNQAEDEKNQFKNHTEILQKEIMEVKTAKEGLDDNIHSLQVELQNHRDITEKNLNEMNCLNNKLQEQRDANSQLRAYIAQVQQDEHARDQWKVEKIEMISAISALNDNKEELQKTLEMLNVRFQSVSKILEMQEQAISAHTTAIPDPQGQNKAAIVTSQWRAKVFELMVQCKTQEIINQEQDTKHKLIVQELKARLEDQCRESEILTNRYRDVEAQLQLKNHLNQSLESSNLKLKQELEEWREKCCQQAASVEKLHGLVKSVSVDFARSYEDGMTACMEKCLRMEQRLAFANNRIRTIQDLLKRKDSMWRVRLQQALRNENGEVVAEKKTEENPDLRLEILQLTEERNSLSQQLAHDAAQFETTTKAMKKIEENQQKVNRSLEKRIISYEEKLQELNSKLQDLETKLDDEKYENDSLINELKQTKSATKKDVEDALEAAKQHHYAELQDNESAMNQVKKDLTKAIVALRQAERSSIRDKNQLSEQLEVERRHWLNEEEKLRNNIRGLQKDNNLLMTTLRQEGLLSAVKATRASPMIQQGEDETPPKRVHFNPFPSDLEKNEPEKTNDVDKMLKDLTNLSEMVLASSDTEE